MIFFFLSRNSVLKDRTEQFLTKKISFFIVAGNY